MSVGAGFGLFLLHVAVAVPEGLCSTVQPVRTAGLTSNSTWNRLGPANV
jgi:hypothetical protein